MYRCNPNNDKTPMLDFAALQRVINYLATLRLALAMTDIKEDSS